MQAKLRSKEGKAPIYTESAFDAFRLLVVGSLHETILSSLDSIRECFDGNFVIRNLPLLLAGPSHKVESSQEIGNKKVG